MPRRGHGRAHVLSSVIISFKCGALANPLDLGPRSVNLTFFLRLLPRLHSRLFILSYYSTLLISSCALLPPLNPRRYYILPPVLPSILGEFRFFFLPPFFLRLLLCNVPAVLPATPRRLSRTSTRLLQLARLRFPQDNR